MDYWFLFVFVVLFSYCFPSQETRDVKVKKGKKYAIAKNLSREHELVSIMEPGAAEDILEDGFKTVIITIHRINKRLDKVVARMKPNSTQSDAKLEAVLAALYNYSENVVDKVMKRNFSKKFAKKCKIYLSHKAFNFPGIAEVNSSLFSNETMKSMSELGDFLISSNFILLTSIKKNIIGNECFKVILENDHSLYRLKIYRNRSRRDLSKIVSFLKKKYLSLESNMNGTQEVKDYVSDYQLRHQHQPHQKFVDTVYKHLTEKYFWRNWLVVSFCERDVSKLVDDIRVNSEYSFYIDKGYNRSIFVSSPDNVNVDVFAGNFDVCFNRSQSPPSCNTCNCYTQIKKFYKCLGAMDLRGIVCVWREVNMKFKGGPSGYKVYSLLMPQEYLGVQVNRTLMAETERDFIVVL